MSVIDEVSTRVRNLLLAGDDAGAPEIAHAIDAVFDDAAISGLAMDNEAAVRGQLHNHLLGFGVLQTYLDDPEIEEIWINQPNQIFVAKGGASQAIEADLAADTIRTLALRMLRGSGRRVDSSLPFADAMLPDGSRLHVVIPDITAQHWSLNIRKFPARILTIDDLQDTGTLAAKAATILREAVADGKNILVSGATHSGKTTLLCALLADLPSQTRLITCEETFEIRSNLADRVAMQARQPNLEGGGEITLRRLVREALRMRPDRLVVGEVREAESLDLLVAMNSGVPGACTIHANSAAAAITKLCTLPLLAGPNISADFVRATVAESVDLVIHCQMGTDGRRRVVEIAEVSATSDGSPTVQRVWP